MGAVASTRCTLGTRLSASRPSHSLSRCHRKASLNGPTSSHVARFISQPEGVGKSLIRRTSPSGVTSSCVDETKAAFLTPPYSLQEMSAPIGRRPPKLRPGPHPPSLLPRSGLPLASARDFHRNKSRVARPSGSVGLTRHRSPPRFGIQHLSRLFATARTLSLCRSAVALVVRDQSVFGSNSSLVAME